MKVQGGDCSIVIKTSRVEMDVPYSSETVREAVSMLYEEAGIEGDGIRRGIKTTGEVTGCVVTPLTIGTAPLLLYLAMGGAGLAVFVSETRNLYYSGSEVELLIDDLSAIAKEAIEQAGAEAARAAALASIERQGELLREKAAAMREAERWQLEAETARTNGRKNMFIGIMAGLLGGIAIGITESLIIRGM